MSEKETPVIVVVDDGHFNAKGILLSDSYEPVHYLMPTMVMKGHSTAQFGVDHATPVDFNTLDEDGNEVYYNVVEKMSFGMNGYLVDTGNEDFQTSEANRVLVHAMLHKMGLAGKKVILYATSPMQRYFHLGGTLNEGYINKRNENLMKPVQSKDGKSVEVISTTQVPEGFATYLSVLLKPNKNKKRMGVDISVTQLDILILDFGGQTLDVAVISNGQLVTNSSYTEEGMGMLKIYEHLTSYLSTYRKNISRTEMAEIIETGIFYTDKKRKNKIDVSDQVQKIIKDVLSTAMDKINSRTPTREFDRVLIAGGGVLTIEKEIKLYIDEAEMVSDPLYANALGSLFMAYSEVESKSKKSAA
ncbi:MULTISPECIES: ParM/StbA family protein [Vibrio]|uniref:ParM/StbA family protein n=1 Tax=Vibrio tasmaniensis TaxID=212663 RepID=A0A2N7NNC0_9VIBR|nr:ParM/StbA family protein [Vibrio tasmaniensis]PMO80344.1 hypothetical protein BCT01_08615 [Vibrio tasmaniensis]PMP17788.1 hypothetical protein BCS92_05115 [Vibrio tasmaniensis]TKG28993.1 ParM/StbA family protein [Vibrio tasmaniensis]TKG41608.1 ParM/StbA family protein [Vibrio tasmaniensis]TKG46257.1 ParM/StbA family protein [Vibrio tasmaniensis]